MLRTENLTAGYGDKEVLHNIEFEVPKGKLTCILGPNGCGKSTLVKTAAGLIRPIKGSVTLDGADVFKMTRQEVAKKTAYLAQGKNTPDMTVFKLVLHGRFPHLCYPRIYKEKDKRVAKDAMRELGIDKLSEEKMSSLSGGMRQSAYIAMAVAQSTEYILLDEPTTYLDIKNRIKLMHMMKKLAENGKGVAAVLHDVNLALEFADLIFLMEDGKTVCYGTPDEVFSSGAVGRVFGVKLYRTRTDYGYAYYYGHTEEE